MKRNTLENALIALKGNNFRVDMNICRALTKDDEKCDDCCLREFRNIYCSTSAKESGEQFYKILLQRVRKQKLEKLLS